MSIVRSQSHGLHRSTTTCPDCDGTLRITQSGRTVCEQCCVVVDEQPIERSEPQWKDEAEKRTGPGQSLQYIYRGTTFDPSKAGSDTTHRFHRYKKQQQRLRSDYRRLDAGLKELRAIGAALELARSVREDAALLYRRSAKEGTLAGRGIEAVAAACIVASSRRSSGVAPLPFAWVAEHSCTTESDVINTYRKVAADLRLEIVPPEPTEYLSRLAGRCDVPAAVAREAIRRIRYADEETYHSPNPVGLAGAALYAVTQETEAPLTQEQVAAAAGVSPFTISKQWTRFDSSSSNS